MKKTLATLSALSLMMTAALASAEGRGNNNSEEVQLRRELAQLRQATSKYQDVKKAERDGYALESPFVPGMGYHYVNAVQVFLSGVDAHQPEALVYDSNDPKQKSRNLVAVEYLLPDPDQVIPREELPLLFATQTSHDWHYEPFLGEWTLHVWIWLDNPEGVFNPTNPRVNLGPWPE